MSTSIDGFTRVSGFAGVIGPVVFVTVFLVLGRVTPGYSSASDVISNLELGQMGWVQQLNFFQMGALIIVLALGFRRVMAGITGRSHRLPTALYVLSGFGMVVAAFFTPADPVPHVVGGFFLFIFPLLIAMFVTSRQFFRAGLSRLGVYTLVNTILVLVLLLYFLFGLGLSAPAGGVPTGITGIINRAFVALALSWFGVIGLWIIRLSPKRRA